MQDYGQWIRTERMRRGWSQEELCKGICTVSYLSRIESGKAEPSEDTLRLLMDKLELSADEQTQQRAARLAADGFERLFSGLLPKSMELERFRATRSFVTLQLLQQFADKTEEPLIKSFEAQMDTRALFLQRILEGRFDEAARLLPCAFLYYRKGLFALQKGDALSAIDALGRGYALAAEEGRAPLMLQCKLALGRVYGMRRESEALRGQYAVAARLARALKDAAALHEIVAGLADADLWDGAYDRAYHTYAALKQPDARQLFCMALCCEKTDRAEEGLRLLDRAEGLLGADEPQRLLCRVLRYRLEHPTYLDDEGYGVLLSESYARCRKQSAPDAALLLPWMREWLTATRQYKKAYELLIEPGA